MKKVVSVCIIIIMIFTLVGCSNKKVIKDNNVTKENRVFKGENDSWTAEFKVDSLDKITEENSVVVYDSQVDKLLTVTYKKDLADLAKLKKFRIHYNSGVEGNYRDVDVSKNPINEKTFHIQSSGKGIAAEEKDAIIEVNIITDGKLETIELKNVK